MRSHPVFDDRRPLLRRLAQGAIFTGMTLASLTIHAQDMNSPDQRPSNRPLPAPDYTQPAPVLPDASPTLPAADQPLSAREQVFVQRIELTGNTVFTDEELAVVTAPYENRTITEIGRASCRERVYSNV